MTTTRAPKQWQLTRRETVGSLEHWRQNMLYVLENDESFTPLLVDGVTWLADDGTDPHRGFTSDTEGPAAQRKTAAKKVKALNLMLGQIANFCPVIARCTITEDCKSLAEVWNAIRAHYGFQKSGGSILNLVKIQREHDESPNDLFERLKAFFKNSLMSPDDNIRHKGAVPDVKEKMSPTLENTMMVLWLHLLHKDLPALVKERFATALRSQSLMSLKAEITDCLDSLMHSVEGRTEQVTSARAFVPNSRRGSFRPRGYGNQQRPRVNRPMCPLCYQAGRTEVNHQLSICHYLPAQDKQYIQGRNIDCDEEQYEDEYEELTPSPTVARVSVKRSPVMRAHHDSGPVDLLLDTGAEASFIQYSAARALGLQLYPNRSQIPRQADGSTSLGVRGEVHTQVERNGCILSLDALVVDKLSAPIIAGAALMDANDLTIRPKLREITLPDGSTVTYAARSAPLDPAARSISVDTVRAPAKNIVLWPGDSLDTEVRTTTPDSTDLLIAPREDAGISSIFAGKVQWPSPQTTDLVGKSLRFTNHNEFPVVIKKNSHLCTVSLSTIATEAPKFDKIPRPPPTPDTNPDQILIDPDGILPPTVRQKFLDVCKAYKTVFSSKFRVYNGAYGPFEAQINMGPVQPPQRKGRVPQYQRDNLVILQQKCDELEDHGVLAKPEDVGITVEYISPSILIIKANGAYRMVTAFADVGRYAKPQPALLPDVNFALRAIAEWVFIIKSDLASAFYQIPMARKSMKYCGIATPFKGVRVYQRCAMGMPGSETALEELMSRVLGDLIMQGKVVKIADDIYVGGATAGIALDNWTEVLEALDRANLTLSAKKTVICPATTNILGWIWSQGQLKASPHILNTLSTCNRPGTPKALTSFIGTFKVISRVLPRSSKFIAPLEDMLANQSKETKLTWADTEADAFKAVRDSLKSVTAITTPRKEDQLWIVMDASPKEKGLGAAMYVQREEKVLPAGYFSAKLRTHQRGWLPCEVEALSIAASLKHFSPYVVQSAKTTRVLTDSKPCAEALEKLARGEFSASPRVLTFLSVAAQYQVRISHLAGTANLPADFASCNAPDCTDEACQICRFVGELTRQPVLRAVETTTLPTSLYTTRTTWLAAQAECPDVRRAKAHLRQGTRPNKKQSKLGDVRRYINRATLASDGLLVVKAPQPFAATKELIVVPRSMLSGLLMSIHLYLGHPSTNQLKLVTGRSLFALDMDTAVKETADRCSMCVALKKLPKEQVQQSSCAPPAVVGRSFAVDVIKRARQLILVCRETVTSYTNTTIIESETAADLRNGIIRTCMPLRVMDGPTVVVRTDPAPGFQSLREDRYLRELNIQLELGREKNPNKNPVAERAIQDVYAELKRRDPTGQPVSETELTIVTELMNSRIRSRGMSAREMMFQRDQFSGEQIEVKDDGLIGDQQKARSLNHEASKRSKSKIPRTTSSFGIGDLIFLKGEGSKSRARERYIVTEMQDGWCSVNKFTGKQLRARSYRVKAEDCVPVPCESQPVTHANVDEPQINHKQPPSMVEAPEVLVKPHGIHETKGVKEGLERVHSQVEYSEKYSDPICEHVSPEQDAERILKSHGDSQPDCDRPDCDPCPEFGSVAEVAECPEFGPNYWPERDGNQEEEAPDVASQQEEPPRRREEEGSEQPDGCGYRKRKLPTWMLSGEYVLDSCPVDVLEYRA